MLDPNICYRYYSLPCPISELWGDQSARDFFSVAGINIGEGMIIVCRSSPQHVDVDVAQLCKGGRVMVGDEFLEISQSRLGF